MFPAPQGQQPDEFRRFGSVLFSDGCFFWRCPLFGRGPKKGKLLPVVKIYPMLVPVMLPEPKGDTRDIIAHKLDAGMSGSTLERGMKVYEEAQKGNEVAQKEMKKLDDKEITTIPP